MSGTNKQISFYRFGTGTGSGMPDGNLENDLLQWNGSEWIPRQLSDILAGIDTPVAYPFYMSGTIVDAVPAGYKLIQVTLLNTGSVSVMASVGLTEGGTDILDNEVIESGQSYDIPMNRFLSAHVASSIFVNVGDTVYEDELILIVETKFYYKP